jgi:Zn finger protein HypA/HybF involved in hydrogenase expression
MPETFGTLRIPREVNTVAEAYCVKCKAKKEIAKAQEVTMKNGRPAMQGVCPDCGTKLFRIMGGKK